MIDAGSADEGRVPCITALRERPAPQPNYFTRDTAHLRFRVAYGFGVSTNMPTANITVAVTGV
jgi:hypothetical protein